MQTQWLNNIGQFTKQNSPTILSAIAIGGVITTAILAVRATPKAVKRIEELGDNGELKVTRKEVVKATWALYIPAAVSGAATIGCIVGANQIGMRRNAALLAAGTLAEKTLMEYKNKVIEKIGEAKERDIGDAIMEDRIKGNDPPKEVLIISGNDVLCYESYSGRYFRGDIEKIKQAQNDFMRRILNGDMCASYNEWCDELGLPHVEPMGERVGWNIQNNLEIIISSHLNECSGEPAAAIRYRKEPIIEFEKVL